MDPRLEEARLENRRQEAGQERGPVAAASTSSPQQHEIEWIWVKGHAGHDGNERADELANRGVESVRPDAEHLTAVRE